MYILEIYINIYNTHRTYVLVAHTGRKISAYSQKIIRQLLCRALLRARCAVYFSWQWERFGSVVSKTAQVT